VSIALHLASFKILSSSAVLMGVFDGEMRKGKQPMRAP